MKDGTSTLGPTPAKKLEAAPGLEPGIRALQARALAAWLRRLGVHARRTPASSSDPDGRKTVETRMYKSGSPESIGGCGRVASRVAAQEDGGLWHGRTPTADLDHQAVPLRLHGLEEFRLRAMVEPR